MRSKEHTDKRTETHACVLISQQAAIDAVNNAFDRETLLTGFVRSIAVRAIRDMPSAQPEQQWIPVTERLPKKDGRYQVTRYDYVANTEFIDILWYEENLWWNRHSTGDYAVTAWMPLPELYKEGGADV